MKTSKAIVLTILVTVFCLSGCSSKNNVLSLQNIPRYPAAAEGQSMEGSALGGMMGGELLQLFTTDPFDSVVDFYANELDKYNPETISHESESGRQTAITIKQDKKVVTVAVQEHKEENRVIITHMIVGS